MSTLVSPGVRVTVTDESIGVPSSEGTIPFIMIATQENKLDPSGTEIAEGTLAENAGRIFTITSQRELLQTFGNPTFYSVGGTQLHGFELNEYGLLAAHSYLGVSNRALVMRANVDLAQLQASVTAPAGELTAGTHWFDLSESRFGLFSFNAGTGKFESETVRIINSEDDILLNGFPKQSIGLNGEFAVVTARTTNRIFNKIAGVWLQVGEAAWRTTTSLDFQYASHTNIPTTRSDTSALQNGDLWIKTTPPDNGALYVVNVFDGAAGQFIQLDAPLFATRNEAVDFYTLPLIEEGNLFVHFNPLTPLAGSAAEHHILRWNGETLTEAVGTVENPTVSTNDQLIINGTTVTFTSTTLEDVVADINNAGITNIEAFIFDNKLRVVNKVAKDIVFDNGAFATTLPTTALGLNLLYTNWEQLVYEANLSEPSPDPDPGTLWFSSNLQVDILRNNGLGVWEDYSPTHGTVFLQPSQPTSPSAGDLWIDSSDLENYPVIWRFDGAEFVLIDNTDQTSPEGIVFADARPDPADPLDADAPDPLNFPAGMLLFNTRYSTFNVKEFVPDYTFEGTLIGDRFVTISGLKPDGSPWMGRRAVKQVIVMKMAAELAGNEDIRADDIFFNLIAAPGFVELIDEMVSLNVDRRQTAFVIGDSPFRLRARGTDIVSWATNAPGAASNSEEGLVTSDTYLGVYYPSGLSTNLDGAEVVVPPSHMVLRTMAFNDQVAFPWFAPAGFQRGVVSNATTAGFITSEGEFQQVALSDGLRDTLQLNNINPIAFFINRGLVVFGQKTRHPVASALDRINVARLTNFIRSQAEELARPFLFEPNDAQTRKSAKAVFDSFLAELVTLRGVGDFLVVLDETNNTPARIDRNELWIDIAISPIRSAEMIFIPVRIRSTGADLTI